MAGKLGKAGRPQSTKDYFKILLRVPPDLQGRLEHCHALLQRQHGPKTTQTEALWYMLKAGCDAIEQTLEGREAPVSMPISKISDISSAQILKISERAGDDLSVPGYGFPEDGDESPTPASHTNGQGTAAPQPTTQPAIPLALEPAPTAAPPLAVAQASETPSTTSEPIGEQTPSGQTPAPQPERREPAVQTRPEISADIVKIAEARTQYDNLSERAFIQLLYDRGMYRHRAKDGSEVPLPHSTYRDWMQRARAAGLL